jgi:hypothetical protein
MEEWRAVDGLSPQLPLRLDKPACLQPLCVISCVPSCGGGSLVRSHRKPATVLEEVGASQHLLRLEVAIGKWRRRADQTLE